MKYGLIAYLVIALLILLFSGFGDDQDAKPDWGQHPALKAMGIGK